MRSTVVKRKILAPPIRMSSHFMGCEENLRYEKERMDDIVPGFSRLVSRSDGSLIILSSDKGYYNPRSMKNLQKSGDAIISRNGMISNTLDFKFEKICSPNMFFEVWSNMAGPGHSRNKSGWGVDTMTDFIVYAFSDYSRMAVISLKGIRSWLGIRSFHAQDVDMSSLEKRFSIRGQNKYQQANVPIGCLIPFSDMPETVLVGSICMEDEWHYAPGHYFCSGLPANFGDTPKNMAPVPMEDRGHVLL